MQKRIYQPGEGLVLDDVEKTIKNIWILRSDIAQLDGDRIVICTLFPQFSFILIRLYESRLTPVRGEMKTLYFISAGMLSVSFSFSP